MKLKAMCYLPVPGLYNMNNFGFFSAPSFHHRARSPSPSQQNPTKKDEHQSRDSHKRRCHLDVKGI